MVRREGEDRNTDAPATEGERVTSTEAGDRLGELLHRVAVGGERITITRHGRPMAVLIPAAA